MIGCKGSTWYCWWSMLTTMHTQSCPANVHKANARRCPAPFAGRVCLQEYTTKPSQLSALRASMPATPCRL